VIDQDVVRGRLYDWCSVAVLNFKRMWESYVTWKEAYWENGWFANWIAKGRPDEWASSAKTWRKRVTWGMVWRLDADVQAFVNSAAQVQKCVKLLGADDYPPPPDGPSIVDVRNFEEHWEDPYEFTVSRVEAHLDNGIKPGMISAVTGDLLVGNLSTGALWVWIEDVRQKVAADLIAGGFEAPTPRQHVWSARSKRLRRSPRAR